MSQYSNPGDIGICGVQLYLPYVLGFGQAHVFPMPSIVIGLVNANTCIGGAAAVHFTCAYPDGPVFRSFLRPVNGNVAKEENVEAIHDRCKALAIVGSVPKAAGSISH